MEVFTERAQAIISERSKEQSEIVVIHKNYIWQAKSSTICPSVDYEIIKKKEDAKHNLISIAKRMLVKGQGEHQYTLEE